MFKIMLAFLMILSPAQNVARCTGYDDITTSDSPDFVVRNSFYNNLIISAITVRPNSVPWATSFGRDSHGIYISYKLDANAVIYLLLTSNRLIVATPHLKAGPHEIAIELWSYRALYQRHIYCFSVPK